MNDAATASTEPPPYYSDEEPPCFCKPSVPWTLRHYNGIWDEQRLESRTCRCCGATMSRALT